MPYMTTEENKKPSVAHSTALMSACTLLSRITGFVRTWAMAFALGNTVMAAGFSLANNLPNMIYELVAGGVFSTAFLPIYLQLRNQKGRAAGDAYASNLLSLTVVGLGVVSVAASVFAPQVMVTQSLFSSNDAETVTAAVWFFRFLAFEILFYGLSALFSGLLSAQRRFLWPSLCSVFMNVIAIVGFFAYPPISAVSPTAGTTWLGVTMALSIAVMALVQVPALAKTGFRFRFHLSLHGDGLRETVQLALPAIACTAINLVALSFMNSCALHVAANGPSSVSYAWMWYQFPYGVLCVALSTALFTEMSDCTARRDWEGFRTNLRSGLRSTWLLIIPLASLVFVCAEQLIGLYAAGRFTAEDIAPIAALLRGWAVNLPLYAGYMFVYRAYSAFKDMKTVAVCNLVLTVLQVLLYMVFTGVIDLGLSLGLVGLACADICFYGAMLVTLLFILHHSIRGLALSTLVMPTVKVSIASLGGAGVAAAVAFGLNHVINTGFMGGAFVALCITGLTGLTAIYILCRLLGVQEITQLATSIKRKLHR